MSDPVPLIELRAITRRYGTGDGATAALRGISLTVDRGEFVAIVGPSGAGKSTLLNILGLLDRPTDGTHLMDGTDVGSLSERERDGWRSRLIGFVFQDSHVLLDASAAENVALGLKIQRVPYRERRSLAGSALRRLGMLRRATQPGRYLSGGERQRVAIARAIATEPALLLADEPTGALDSRNSRRIIAYLHELNASGMTILVITHDPVVAAAAHRRVTLTDGRLVDGEDSAAPRTASAAPTHTDTPTTLRERARRHLRGLVDDAADAVSSQVSRPFRAALLATAFLLGTAGLVCSLGISQTAATQVAQTLTEAGLDEVVVRAADPRAYAAGFYENGSPASAAGRIATLDGVTGVGFLSPVSGTVSARPPEPGTPLVRAQLFRADASYLRVQGATVDPAPAAGLLDNTWNGRVAVIGRSAATRLGIPLAGPGRVIWVSGRPVDVVGIVTNPGRAAGLDDAILLSSAAAEGLRAADPQLIVRTVPGYPAPVSQAIPYAVDPADLAGVRVETVADLRQVRRGVSTDLGTLVGLISVVLLLLATLSAATAMYLTVQTRSPEIGLRRALGASRASIWRMFTFEGLFVGTAGGIAGAALGMWGLVAVCLARGWTPTLDPSNVVVGILAGALTGVVSSAYPAAVAARADPAATLRA